MTEEKPKRRRFGRKIDRNLKEVPEMDSLSEERCFAEYQKKKEKIKIECLEFSYRFIKLDIISSQALIAMPRSKAEVLKRLKSFWKDPYDNQTFTIAFGVGRGCQTALTMMLDNGEISTPLYNYLTNLDIPPWHPQHEIGSVWWEDVLSFMKTIQAPRIREKRAVRAIEILKEDGYYESKKFLQVNYGN